MRHRGAEGKTERTMPDASVLRLPFWSGRGGK
nr:MAG TPA: hypothetical protein [Caudoviricetes sp.]